MCVRVYCVCICVCEYVCECTCMCIHVCVCECAVEAVGKDTISKPLRLLCVVGGTGIVVCSYVHVCLLSFFIFFFLSSVHCGVLYM